jgi:hypothetical protein
MENASNAKRQTINKYSGEKGAKEKRFQHQTKIPKKMPQKEKHFQP